MNPHDVRIVDIDISTTDHGYRTPIKFGGIALDRATVLDAEITVEGRNGKRKIGRGSMPLGNVWAYPSKSLTYEETLGAMQAFADCAALAYCRDGSWGHPVEIAHRVERQWASLKGEMPMLAALVAASPFDAALHDAYGKLHGQSSYQLLGEEFLVPDLGEWLGREFAGRRLDAGLRSRPIDWLPLYHLVGALDPLTDEYVTNPIGDGEPESLADWIARDGLTHLKIKLNGDDPVWDADRVANVNRVAESIRGDDWHFSLDFNERCSDGAALVEFLERLRSDCPRAFERIHYVEQPTSRNLDGGDLHSAALLKPLVLDEGLIDLDSLLKARDMGYNGVALKACKGQTSSLLMAAASQHMNLFLCVQDLTCPGASFVHSAGLAAHVKGVAAIEGNARQYMPAANREWIARMPELFTVTNGRVRTGTLRGPGISR